MASYVDMSLEDIIQKKKKENLRTKNMTKPKFNRPKNELTTKKKPIADARNKIISKKRIQITDARDKLAQLAKQKDARLKLEQLRLKRAMTQQQGRKPYQNPPKFTRNAKKDRGDIVTRNKVGALRVFVDPSRQVVSQPFTPGRMPAMRQLNTKRFMESRSVETRTSGRDKMHNIMLKPIVRTVANDLDLSDDPMEEDYAPPKVSANMQLRIIAHNSDIRGARSSTARRLTTPEKERSPPRPTSILKKRPMAALRTEKKMEKTEKPALEYRIIVSNLRNTVTGGDIEELFGDVGGMVESRLVRPGTAEVIYKTAEDAQKAVDLYHNRQLDGQPMNCLLVTPRAPATSSSRNGSKPALHSSNSNVEPDISTFHKVLFNHF